MIFERKIIIGSIVSCVATVLGIITVFFPDMFNMQKSDIAYFESEIHDLKSAERFNEFLEENANAIVKLKISVCNNIGENNYQSQGVTVSLDARQEDYSSLTISEEDNGGTEYIFNNSTPEWHKFEECSTGGGAGANIINDYFLVSPDLGFAMGWISYSLSMIPARDVAIKNY